MHDFKGFLIFVSIVFTVYGGINFYIYKRIMEAAALTGYLAWILRIILLILILAFPVSRFIGSKILVGNILTWIGAFWLGAMAYFLLSAAIFDEIRISDKIFHWFPRSLITDKISFGRYILGITSVIIITTIILGYIHASKPIVKHIHLESNKLPKGVGEYSVVFLSDLHLGHLIGPKRTGNIIAAVNDLNPNLILIGGDIFDEHAWQIPWAKDSLSKLSAEDGVFAVTGNHEYYHGLDGFKKILEDSGIRLLEDESFEIAGKINLIGLSDITGIRQFKVELIPILNIVDSINNDLPVILMNHTPVRIKEASEANVDIMLSGHTHGGQMFPGGLIAYAIFRVKKGMSKIGNMDFYLSTGAGTWGPPVRVGTDSEIILLTITGNGN